MNLAVCHFDLGNNVAEYDFDLPLPVSGRDSQPFSDQVKSCSSILNGYKCQWKTVQTNEKGKLAVISELDVTWSAFDFENPNYTLIGWQVGRSLKMIQTIALVIIFHSFCSYRCSLIAPVHQKQKEKYIYLSLQLSFFRASL